MSRAKRDEIAAGRLEELMNTGLGLAVDRPRDPSLHSGHALGYFPRELHRSIQYLPQLADSAFSSAGIVEMSFCHDRLRTLYFQCAVYLTKISIS